MCMYIYIYISRGIERERERETPRTIPARRFASSSPSVSVPLFAPSSSKEGRRSIAAIVFQQ